MIRASQQSRGVVDLYETEPSHRSAVHAHRIWQRSDGRPDIKHTAALIGKHGAKLIAGATSGLLCHGGNVAKWQSVNGHCVTSLVIIFL